MEKEQLIQERIRIGSRIRELREEAGWSLEDLADRTGLLRQNIHRIERGNYNTGQDILCRIAKAFGKDLNID